MLQINLKSSDIHIHLEIGPKPPPEQEGNVLIEDPLVLARQADLCWAINTNPWQYPENPRACPIFPGEAANITGWAKTGNNTRQTPCKPCWEIWVNEEGQVYVGNVEDHPDEIEKAQLGAGGYQGLIRNGELLIDKPSGRRAPRTALGLDKSRSILTWVVVDKGIPAGMPGWREVMNTHELALLMQELGCWNAYNADGGGSSIMIKRGDPDNEQWIPVNEQARYYRRAWNIQADHYPQPLPFF